MEKRFEALSKTLGRGWIHNELQRLKDLNLLISCLAITLDSIQEVHLGLTEGIKGNAFTVLPEMLIKPILHLLPQI